MFVASIALVASSWDSYWMNAKFLLILTFIIFPYGSKCLSKSLVLVWYGSKLMTNNVFEGLEFVEDFLVLSGLLVTRSCWNTTIGQLIQDMYEVWTTKFPIFILDICYLCPLNTKAASLSAIFITVKSSNCILRISIILHINKSKSYREIKQNESKCEKNSLSYLEKRK